MIARLAVLCFLAGALAFARPANAQPADRSVVLGITAYRALEYDSAAARFRQALGASGNDSLINNRRADVLTYLGAAELLRGDSAAAAAEFVRAIALDRRYRIDELVFPPAVTRAFEDARLTTAYFDVSAPEHTIIRVNSDSLPLQLFASAPGEITITLMRQNGQVVRQIYSGTIKDSLRVFWNGMDAAGNAATGGPIVLQVKSSRALANSGETTIPLSVEMLPVDTVRHPVEPTTAPRTVRGVHSGSSVRALVAGTLIGSAAIFLPEFIGENRNAMPERFVVGATLGAAGVLGFFSGRRQGEKALADSVAADKSRDIWQRAVESVKQENARRLRSPQLRIISGAQTIRTGGHQ